MRKPARSRVLLITGSHVSALDFNLLLENLSREHISGGGDGGVRRQPSRHREQDGRCGTAWASEDDLAPARDFINRQTELVVIVTPYTVRATAARNLSRPDDGFADASDPATVLLGRLNRIYGVPAKNTQHAQQNTYRGNYGFILD